MQKKVYGVGTFVSRRPGINNRESPLSTYSRDFSLNPRMPWAIRDRSPCLPTRTPHHSTSSELHTMLPRDTTTSEADEFRVMLDAVVPKFLDQLTSSLQSAFDLDVATLQADHICWRTGSQSEYSKLLLVLQNDPDRFHLLIESEIGGRPIATFALQRPITSTHHSVHILEIPSPKETSPYPAGLEHAEFVIGDRTCTSPWNNDTHQETLKEFQQTHSKVPWNSKAMEKEVNPDISVKVTLDGFGTCSAKFHLMALENVIAAEKAAVGPPS